MSANTPHHSRFFWRSSAMFCLLDGNECFSEVNSAWEKSLGLSTGQLLSKSFYSFIFPEDQPSTQYYFQQLKEGMVSTSFSARFRHRDNSYRQILWEITASASQEKEHAFYVVGVDITGRERPSIADEIVSVLPEGVVVQYANGTIGACNSSAEQIIGLSSDQMIGWTLIDPDWNAIREDGSPFPSETHPAICALRTGQPYRDVVMGVEKTDGSVFWLRINATPLWRDDVTTPYAVVISFSDITHYKNVEQTLRQHSEQPSRGPGGTQEAEADFWNWSLDSNRLNFSPSWKQMLGYGEHELPNHLDSWYERIHPVDYKRVVADVQNHLEGVTPQFENTHRLQHKDGSYRWMLCRGSAVRDSNGKAVAMVGMHIDITEQRRLEDKLKEAEIKYSQLLETEPNAVFLVDASDPGNEKILEANKSASQMYNYNRNEFLGMTLSDLSAQSEKGVKKSAKKLSKKTRQRYHRKKDDSVFAVQITINPFTLQNRELALIVVSDNTEQQKIETALWESQSKYRQLFEASSYATIVFDANSRQIFDVNNVAVDMYGYTKDEWLHLTTDDISAEPVKSRAAFTSGKKHQVIPLRWHKKKDSTVFPVEISTGSSYLFQGRSLVCATLRDITERKASEEALRKERDFVNTLVQASPAFFFAINPDGSIRMVNDAMLQALGYQLDEVLGSNYLDKLVPPNEKAMVSAEFENLTKSMRPSLMESQVLSRDGKTLRVEWHSRAIVQADGNLDYLFGVGIDITERVRAQDDLRLFKAIIEASEEAIAISDPHKQLIYINPAHEKLLGRPLEEARVNNRDYYTPESQEVIRREVEPGLLRGEGWTGELDMVDAQGNLFPAWQRFDAVRDGQGNMLFTFELMHNISERKRMWETLRSQWEEYQLIFNNVPLMLWHKDRDDRLLRSNKLAGDTFPNAEITRELFADDPPVDADSEAVYHTVEVYSDTTGNTLWLHAGRIPYRDSGGGTIGSIVFAIDITPYKRAGMLAEGDFSETVQPLLNSLPLALAAFDAQGRVVAWNKAAERLSGYSEAELKSLPNSLELLYPDAELRHQIRHADRDYRDLECPLVCKDGSRRHLRWTSIAKQFPVPAWHTWQIGVEAVAAAAPGGKAKTPLTDDMLLPYIFHATRIGVSLTDDRGRFLKVNQAYADLYGYRIEELLGQPFTMVLPPKRHDEAIRDYFSLLITEDEPSLLRHLGDQNRNGRTFNAAVMSNRIILEDGRRLLVSIVTRINNSSF